MRRPEQNRGNYGINPQNRNRGQGNNFNKNYEQFASNARNSDWNHTDDHFSADHDNNFDASSRFNDYNSTYNDGNRSAREMGRNRNGYDSNHNTDFSDVGLATRSHRMNGNSSRGYGYSDSYDSDMGEQGLSDQWNRSSSTGQNRTGHYGKGPKGYRRSDDRIKEDVCEALYAHSQIDASDIEVTVKEGLVTLSGNVESRNLKRQVESEIEGLSGVDDVQNNLKISSDASSGNSKNSSTTNLRNSKLA